MTIDSGGSWGRVRRGAWLGLRSFGPYTVLLVLIWLVEGPEVALRRMTLRVDLLVFVYPLGAALAGGLYGLLESIADRSRWSAMLVGILAVAPWVCGVALAIDRGYVDWTVGHTFVAVIVAVTSGAGFGWGYATRLSGARDVH